MEYFLAYYSELYIDQGIDFNETIIITDDASGGYANISGYTITAQGKKSYYSSNVYITFTCTINDASNGNVSLALDSSNSSNVPAGNYVFDVKARSPQNKVTRVIEGTVTVTPQVT